ncbi:MAG TPA: VWA domain-containing protein [Bacteroidales bacterium]|nr:VWA domain-containing protein [Bacteroidales bacterium]
MRPTFKYIFLVFLFSIFSQHGISQEGEEVGYQPQSRILFIFDASNSMSGKWEDDIKINVARRVLIEMVDSLEALENVELALRVYGHQSPVPPQDCSDTKLEVPFGPNNGSRIRQKLRFITPKGTTPIAHSLTLAANDFPPCSKCRNIIILLTDGIEACDGDPCEVSVELQKKGIALRPFVIGIGNDPGFKETFDCIGEYYDAPSEDQFKQAMKVVITQALNTTSAQINLIDSNKMPTETDVSVVLYDQFSETVRYNMLHTLNGKGNPDTLSLDQLSTYKVVAQTIPPTSVDSVKLVVGKHNHIGIDAPQGFLLIKSAAGKEYENEKILVKKAGQHETINLHQMGTSEKYIVGKYDLEIPIYPLLYLRDVEIKQSYTTTVEIPEPGVAHIVSRKSGYGSIFQLLEDGDQKWVLNLRSGVTRQSYYLQPGSYRIVFRQGDLKSTMYTQIRDFVIKPGFTEYIDLN